MYNYNLKWNYQLFCFRRMTVDQDKESMRGNKNAPDSTQTWAMSLVHLETNSQRNCRISSVAPVFSIQIGCKKI